jgi:hypothetical protein
MRGLAARWASNKAVERAKATGASGFSLTLAVATGLKDHLATDLKDGMEFARSAVATLRSAPGYSAQEYGTTDDEIADKLIAVADEKAKSQRR